MKLLTHLCCAVVILGGMLSAQEAKQQPANRVTHGPYLCDMTGDGVTVVWKTELPSLSWVEVAPENDGHFYRIQRPAFYQTVAGKKLVNRTLHAVRVKNLAPGTKYLYRIFSKDAEYLSNTGWLKYGKPVATPVNPKYSFTTYAPDRESVRFVMFNDIHAKSDFMEELGRDINYGACDFVVFNGDMVSWVLNEEELFKGFLDASVKLFATHTPVMFTRGNHETRGACSDRLQEYFPTRDGNYYQVYYDGGVCFLVLDCGEDKPDTDYEYSGTADYDAYREEQAVWLAKVVETEEFKNAKARVVFLHIPPPVGDWHGNEHLMQTLVPILNKANINLMLSGHTHRYSFRPADDECTFPIIVNGNETYADCTVGGGKLNVKLIGLKPEQNKEHTFEIK